MFPDPHPSRLAKGTRGAALTALALASGIALGAAAGCSTADCKSMKGSGSALGDLVCGGQGTNAPEPDAPLPNACTDIKLVMPGFFVLLEDPTQPLASLREAVKTLGTPQCLDRQHQSCTADTTCPVGDCGADGFCPCQTTYSPLSDLLVITFKGLASIASTVAEPGAPGGSFCVTPAQAALLLPSQINRTCEIRRLLDVLLQQNGGQTLLNDPNVQSVVLNLLRYVEGKTDGVPHYDLFTTLGRMAQNPGICAPSDAYNLLDKALLYYTPAKAGADLGAIQDLLADPLTKQFLAGLSTGNGTAAGRQSLITLVHDLVGTITSADSGEHATAQIDNLLSKVVYPYIEQHQGQAFEAKVKKAVAAFEGLLSTPAGVFPFLKPLLTCINNPVVDNNGEPVGALYDLVSLQSTTGGIDLATLVGAVKTLVTLDPTGQVSRSLRLIIEGARDDDAATEAVRALLGQVLTPGLAQKLLPPLDVLVQKQVLGEVITLLDDLLYKCTPPTKK